MRVVSLFAWLLLFGCSLPGEPAPEPLDSKQAALGPVPAGSFKLRDYGDLSFDGHARFVYHGGLKKVLLVSARPNRGVFAWDGSDWTRIGEPSSRLFMQAAAYDEVNERVVLFGGLEADHVGAMNSRSTWFWEAGAFTERTISGPPAGGGAALVYDAARRRIVFTGGADHTNGTVRRETWLFDGELWTKSDVVDSPASQYAGAAFDRGREVAVAVRPITGSASETWEWNGTIWSRIAAVQPLPYEYSYTLAYDAAMKRVVSVVDGVVWSWDGVTWTAGPRDGREAERKRVFIAYDAARSRLVARNTSASTWEYDGATWYEVPSRRPRARNNAASTYDPARKRMIFFGSTTEATDATWEWGAEGWVRGAQAASMTPSGLGMAYDSRRSRAVLVADNKTWEYDGASWVAVGTAPGAVSLMAFDVERGVMVGLIGSATWTWDGATWKQVVVAGPTSVRDSAMVYDARRERIVRYGGYTDGTGRSQIDETWEWDGAAWSLMSPVARPSARGGHRMAFDARRGLVVLYGGYRHNEVWEYDGVTWVQRQITVAPPGSFSNGLQYDPERDRMVFYASDGTLWEYQPVGDACTNDSECSSGACVAGVCCDRACTASCEVCSTAEGARRDGICEVLPDAGPSCMSSEDEEPMGVGAGGPGRHKKHAKGCSAGPTSRGGEWSGLLLAGLLLVVRARRRGRSR